MFIFPDWKRHGIVYMKDIIKDNETTDLEIERLTARKLHQYLKKKKKTTQRFDGAYRRQR